ncbi:MAG: hypothetical protein AAF674_16825 [Pseudomonadota bacterium]
MNPSKLEISRAIISACDRVSAGFRTIEETTDFVRIQEEVAEASVRKGWENRIIPEMRWQLNDLTPHNCFYIVCRNAHDGSLSAICASKLIDLGPDYSYGEYIVNNYARIHGQGNVPIDRDRIDPALFEIKGRIAYLADFKIYPSPPRIGVSDLCTILYGLSVQHFDPDWMIGFILAASHRNGLAGKYLANTIPSPIRWTQNVKGRRNDDLLMYLSRRDVSRFFRLCVDADYSAINAPEANESVAAMNMSSSGRPPAGSLPAE